MRERRRHRCQYHLDRAVSVPTRVEGESLPGLSPAHRQQLSGGGGVGASHEEQPLLQHCAGVVVPGVEGVLVVEPAGPSQLVAGGGVAGHWETLEDVHGGVVHVTGEGGEAAAGPRGPQLG